MFVSFDSKFHIKKMNFYNRSRFRVQTVGVSISLPGSLPRPSVTDVLN